MAQLFALRDPNGNLMQRVAVAKQHALESSCQWPEVPLWSESTVSFEVMCNWDTHHVMRTWLAPRVGQNNHLPPAFQLVVQRVHADWNACSEWWNWPNRFDWPVGALGWVLVCPIVWPSTICMCQSFGCLPLLFWRCLSRRGSLAGAQLSLQNSIASHAFWWGNDCVLWLRRCTCGLPRHLCMISCVWLWLAGLLVHMLVVLNVSCTHNFQTTSRYVPL